MEAVPRLHMLWFALKSSPEGTSFANLKKYIAEFYQEDPESYSKEVFALETLRNQAMHPTKDGCSIMKRYYCQLHSLQNRFPQLTERGIFTFTWKDLYQNNVHEITNLRFELAAVLFNIAASHTQVGASVTRGDVEGMKLACTHFQCAAWAFGELRERYSNINTGGDFMTSELLVFMQQVCYAQAQECILEKSLIDNRKPNIVAKVTAQIVVYYGAALAALLTGGDDGPVAQAIDSSVYKLWKKYVRFKISYLNCILYLYQGQHAEEQRKMGERLTLYQAAWDKLEEARKESKGLPDQKEINESLVFTADVVEAKRKNAKNENEFIYHESVPELATISAVQGANLVNGIAFSVTDSEVAGDDIFARLVPMKAHEASSMYSEEKAKLLRKYGSCVEEKDAELASFMSSLTLEHLNINEEKANKIPQGIVDRCAALNANKTAIPDLIEAMSQLAEICADVEVNLKEISEMLNEEEHEEHKFQSTTGVKRTPNAHITELTREYQKYAEAHSRAGESNETLRKAMELHVNNLKILARPLQEIQQSVPKMSTELNTNEIFKDVKLIVNKVNEMKAQRAQFHADLRIAVNEDDITAKVIAHGSEEDLQSLFQREIAKHERLTQLIDQNLLAQHNILHALTESYAKAAPVLKTLADVKSKRESFFSSLAASYDVYEDLLGKSAKGLEFYKKLSGNVHKLLTRLKSARDVQSEERQQRLKSVATQQITTGNVGNTYAAGKEIITDAPQHGGAPKLRDYLKAKKTNPNTISTSVGAISRLPDANTVNAKVNAQPQQQPYVPLIRPNPLGSENPSQAACSSNSYYPVTNVSTAPNEPPPPYSLQQQQFYDPTLAGYTNPIYQQQQQNIAPPAYKQQASPNSAFTNMNIQMGQLHLQQQQQMSMQSMQQQQQQPQQQNMYMQYNAHQQQQQHQLQQEAAQNAYLAGSQGQTLDGNPYSSANAYLQSGQVSVTNSFNNQQTLAPNIRYYDAQSLPLTVATQSQGLLTTASNSFNEAPINNLQPTQTTNMYDQSNQNVSNYAQTTAAPTTPTLSTTKPLYVVTNQSTNDSKSNNPQGQGSFALNTVQQQFNIANNLEQQNNAELMMSQQFQNTHQQTVQQQLPVSASIQQYADLPSADGSATNLHGAPGAESHIQYSSLSKHPGYSFNSQTGQYEYGSGYQQATNLNSQFYGQYTSAASAQHTTVMGSDSELANKISVATGFDSPIVSHVRSGNDSMPTTNEPKTTAAAGVDFRYYTPPYGYQSNGIPLTQQQTQLPQQPQQQQQHHQLQQQQLHQQQMQQHQLQEQQQQQQQREQQQPMKSIYMQSGSVSIANTQTTGSGTQYASSTQQTPITPAATTTPTADTSISTPTTTTIKPKIQPNTKQNTNVDLLSDIDFSGADLAVPLPILPEPILKPQVLTTPPASVIGGTNENINPTQPVAELVAAATPAAIAAPVEAVTVTTAPASVMPLQLASTIDTSAPPKSSCDDNFSICSDLSSLDNFDWDSVSMQGGIDKQQPQQQQQQQTNDNTKHSITNINTFLTKPNDPFKDDKTLKYFHKEVERFEKIIECLNVKMLNGHTQLTAKWKELQDLLAKDNIDNKRSTTIAKLFPEKNRSLDCLPYDHARVKLEKNTDDYINAAYIRNLGTGCPNFIIAQTPQQNTINDFWSMIWTQKARTIICLHTTNEMLDPYWPQEVNRESHFDDYSIKCIQITQLSHCVNYHLKLSMHGADPIIDLSILQIKSWSKNTHTQMLAIAANALEAHQKICLEFNTPNSPLVMNCLTGSERSELLAVAICAIVATQIKRPVLINVVDVWSRICSQRQNSLRDNNILEQSMQIVLNHAHDVLNKRGIVTSYQMKMAPQVATKEKDEIKDPLNELDPLWKLK